MPYPPQILELPLDRDIPLALKTIIVLENLA